MSSGYSKVLYATAVIVVLALALVVSGCSGGGSAGDNNGGSSSAQPAVHGTISVGPTVKETTMGITAAGGKVTVNNQSSPINGFSIDVPGGALTNPRTFTVSTAPVTGNTFGKYFDPASPLISIDYGGGYAEDFMAVRIPVNASPSDFVMAFYYDAANKTLEGLPTIDRDATSITVITRHFCDIVLSKIARDILDSINTADSGFRPGTDDWEFSNIGSALVPKGQCMGQSLTMMWYYTQLRQQGANVPQLYGLLDNNGREKTPDVMRDNTLGYRFASIVHMDVNWDAYNKKFESKFKNQTDTDTFKSFKYTILLTGEPQELHLWAADGTGHAIVCYEVSGSTIYVADPNYPGQVRQIPLNGTALTPYNSGENAQAIADGKTTLYTSIRYAAKSAIIPYDSIENRYNEINTGTIGSYEFPLYEVSVSFKGANGSNATKFKGGDNQNVIKLSTNLSNATFSLKPVAPWSYDMGWKIYVDGKAINSSKVVLKEGKNLIGVEGYSLAQGTGWQGYEWVEIDYRPDVATPTPGPSNERKPDRAARTVIAPAAPAPVQMKVINNTDGSSQVYAYYKNSNGDEVTWGSMKTFYPGGKLKSESTRFNSKTVGYTRSYESTGNLIYEQYRDNDGVLGYQDYYASNGKLRLAIDYWSNGQEKDRFDYGDFGGPLQTYTENDQNGNMKLKETWSNGKLVSSGSS